MPASRAAAAVASLAALASLVLLLLLGTAEAQNVTVAASIDTCPSANWQKLPIVKVRTPYATLSALAASPSTKGVDYVKSSIVPKAGANAFFLVLALVFLLAFILWRALRYCCYMCCCKSSCDAKRAQRNPHELLFSRKMLYLKVAMYLFGITAICFAIYGMASTDKALVKKAWTVVDEVSDYTLNLTGTLDHLLGTISNASLIIDDFQTIVTVTMNITGMQANVAAASAFLAAIPDPTTMKTQLGTARADSSALNSALATLSTVVVAMDGTHLPAIKNGLTTLNAAPASLTGFKSLVDDLNTRIGALPVSEPGAGTSDPAYTAFSAAVNAANAGATGTWVTSINSWLSAISTLQGYQGASNNKFTALSTTVSDMSTKATAVGTSVPALSTSLNTLITQNTTGFPVLSSLLAQLATVNTSVLALDANMQSAYDLLTTTLTQLAGVGGLVPTPVALTAQLVAAAGSLAAPASTAALISASNAAASSLDALALGTAATNLNSLKSALSAASFTNAFNTMKTDRDSYASGPSGTTWTTMYNSATAFQPQLPTTSTSMSNTATQLTGVNLGATLTAANAVTTTMLITDQNTYAVAGQVVINALLPNLASGGVYETALTAMGTAYNALGSPMTQVFDAPKAVLDSVYAAAITTGNSVKLQIADTVSSFSGSTGSIKTTITDNIGKYQKDYKDMSEKFDGYRHTASMALYGLSILFILILFASYFVNYHFGTTFASFFLLVICVLYFLLAFISAILLIALGDACPNIEPIIVEKVPSKMLPIVRYYFYNEGSSLKSVLNMTGLVDIDAIMGQVNTSRDSVVNSIAGNYTLRAAPLAVLARVNTTFDTATTDVNALLAAASYAPVHAIYTSIKSLLCCTFPDEFGHMWQGLTFAGVLALAMLLCTFFYIGRIDAAPRKDCCGCTLHTRGRYAASIDIHAPAFALPVHYGKGGNAASGYDGGYGGYGTAPYQAPGTQNMGSSGGYGGYGAVAHVVIGNGKKEGKEGRESSGGGKGSSNTRELRASSSGNGSGRHAANNNNNGIGSGRHPLGGAGGGRASGNGRQSGGGAAGGLL